MIVAASYGIHSCLKILCMRKCAAKHNVIKLIHSSMATERHLPSEDFIDLLSVVSIKYYEHGFGQKLNFREHCASLMADSNKISILHSRWV